MDVANSNFCLIWLLALTRACCLRSIASNLNVVLRKIMDVFKYEPFVFFWNHCNLCMSVCALSLLSYIHFLGLGLDLGNSLDRREGESARALIHESQSFQKKNATAHS